MSLQDYCEFHRDKNIFIIKASTDCVEKKYQYRWVALQSPADKIPPYTDVTPGTEVKIQDNAVLEVTDGQETVVLNPGLRRELTLKYSVKKEYTEVIVQQSKMAGIHSSRICLQDRFGNKLLLSNGKIEAGMTWYLPGEVELGHKGGEWHIVKDRYCDNVLLVNYES